MKHRIVTAAQMKELNEPGMTTVCPIAESSAPLCGEIVCADIGIRDEWHPEF